LRREEAPFPNGAFTAAGMVFRRQRRWYDPDPEAWSRSGEGSLDEAGRLALTEAVSLDPTGGPQRFVLEADVSDSSARHVAGRGSVVLHPSRRYAGVRGPSGWVPAGRPMQVELGVIDTEGKPVVGVPVVGRLERLTWKTVRRRGPGGAISYDW